LLSFQDDEVRKRVVGLNRAETSKNPGGQGETQAGRKKRVYGSVLIVESGG